MISTVTRRWLGAGLMALAACGPGEGGDDVADATGGPMSGDPDDGSEGTSAGPGEGTTGPGPAGTSGGTGSEGGTGTADSLGGVCVGALSASYDQWTQLRDDAYSTYAFTMREQLVFEDACSGDVTIACIAQTRLEVSEGVVVGRTFTAVPATADTLPEDCPQDFEEHEISLGSHDDRGYPVATLDDVYQSCCDLAEMGGGYHTSYDGDYLPDDVVVTIGEDGLLTRCTAQYCDDCGCTGGFGLDVEEIDI